MKTVSVLLLGYLCALMPIASMAGEIENLSVLPQSAKTGQSVEINIGIKKIENVSTSNQASSSILGVGNTSESQSKNIVPCAVLINFGDGHIEHIRVNGDRPSLNISHTYNSNGTYSISAEGKILINGLKSVFGCTGNMLTTVLTVQNNDIAASIEKLDSAALSNNISTTNQIETKGLSSKELLKRGKEAYESQLYDEANIFLSAHLKKSPLFWVLWLSFRAVQNLPLSRTLLPTVKFPNPVLHKGDRA